MPIGLFPAVSLAQNPSIQGNALEFDGAAINNGAAIGAINAIAQNGCSGAGSVNYVTSAASALTATGIAGQTLVLTNAGAVTLTLDNAYNIVNAMFGPTLGQKFPFTVVTVGAAGTVATPTVTNTGITLAGTTSLAATSYRQYQGTLTQLTTTTAYVPGSNVTFTSITQVGSSNLYTVALGANSGATPTVGTVIYLGVTTGSLPPGWYPIYSAASATSFVIAAPSALVYTATAVTFNTTSTTAPVTFAPLITLQGMYSVTTAAA